MRSLKVIVITTFAAVIVDAIIMALVTFLNSGYGFVYLFLMMIGNMILPTLGGVVLYHLLLMTFRQALDIARLQSKFLLSVGTGVLFAALFIGADLILYGSGNDFWAEYKGWIPALAVTVVSVPIIYQTVFRRT